MQTTEKIFSLVGYGRPVDNSSLLKFSIDQSGNIFEHVMKLKNNMIMSVLRQSSTHLFTKNSYSIKHFNIGVHNFIGSVLKSIKPKNFQYRLIGNHFFSTWGPHREVIPQFS